jgi:hypothetical protein
VRLPIAGEVDAVRAWGATVKVPLGGELLFIVRQVEPGNRLRAGFVVPSGMPIPDDEGIAHALFEIATEREPMPPNGDAMIALIKKYSTVKPHA